ncbi:MAG: protein tyrosine phosphatase family protein [Gammaproteobacteria bacterium]
MSHTDLSLIKNYYALGDNVATGGQPTPKQFSAIGQAGFSVVINLAQPDSPGALSDEAGITHGLGMTYEHIPVDFKRPALADLDRFFETLQRHQGKMIFVHCAYNWRVSSFMFLYRTIQCHCPVVEALQDLHAVWRPDDTWQTFIKSALAANRIPYAP